MLLVEAKASGGGYGTLRLVRLSSAVVIYNREKCSLSKQIPQSLLGSLLREFAKSADL